MNPNITPSLSWNAKGLRFTDATIELVRHAIAFYPLDRQADFVHRTMFENVGNNDYLEQNLSPTENYYTDFDNMDATAIGNLAYVVQNAYYDRHRVRAMELLSAYKEYVYKTYKQKRLV